MQSHRQEFDEDSYIFLFDDRRERQYAVSIDGNTIKKIKVFAAGSIKAGRPQSGTIYGLSDICAGMSSSHFCAISTQLYKIDVTRGGKAHLLHKTFAQYNSNGKIDREGYMTFALVETDDLKTHFKNAARIYKVPVSQDMITVARANGGVLPVDRLRIVPAIKGMPRAHATLARGWLDRKTASAQPKIKKDPFWTDNTPFIATSKRVQSKIRKQM